MGGVLASFEPLLASWVGIYPSPSLPGWVYTLLLAFLGGYNLVYMPPRVGITWYICLPGWVSSSLGIPQGGYPSSLGIPQGCVIPGLYLRVCYSRLIPLRVCTSLFGVPQGVYLPLWCTSGWGIPCWVIPQGGLFPAGLYLRVGYSLSPCVCYSLSLRVCYSLLLLPCVIPSFSSRVLFPLSPCVIPSLRVCYSLLPVCYSSCSLVCYSFLLPCV